jgi:hypothetical protein
MNHTSHSEAPARRLVAECVAEIARVWCAPRSVAVTRAFLPPRKVRPSSSCLQHLLLHLLRSNSSAYPPQPWILCHTSFGPQHRSLPVRSVASMSNMSSSIRPTTIAAVSVGAVAAGILAYAVYFDHKRRNDPEFRKQLKRESKRTARAAKEEAEAQGKEQKKSIRAAVEKAREEGFPTDPDQIEMYFMQEVAKGEGLCAQGRVDPPTAHDFVEFR